VFPPLLNSVRESEKMILLENFLSLFFCFSRRRERRGVARALSSPSPSTSTSSHSCTLSNLRFAKPGRK
jgi:hypothetical protein